ncbi:WXG100 family type VII secretion target [Kitasatospora sp. NPDC096147]|uniref:WXG100 family type VII secretion target n=1 Tax=Kitasatospora sp. NPDC096147 TaxID=3364093 RepID=UPI003823B1AE
MGEHTNFNGYSHGDLRRMVGSMDSGGVMSAADPWRRATATLKQIHTSLVTSTSDATTTWEGDSSDAFHTKMTELATHVQYVAAYTNDAAMTLELMSNAIAEAKSTMPEEPSFWSKAADAIGDTASAAAGNDDEDTKTAVTDEKKAQAVAVMNLLATRYRAATDYLKPPPKRFEEMGDVVASDSMGTAAVAAMIMGGGVGMAGGKGGNAGSVTSRVSGPVGSSAPPSPKASQQFRPTDPGIKGGMANPLPKSPSSTPYGPVTGLDGVTTAPKPGGSGPTGPGTTGHGSGGSGGGSSYGGGSGGTSTIGGGQLNGAKSGGGQLNGAKGGGGQLGGGSRAAGPFGGSARGGGSGLGQGVGGSGRAGGAFGAGGMQGAGGSATSGLGGGGLGGSQASRAAGGTGAGAGRMGGGTVGGAAGGGGGRSAFTEGGSGLGRSRGQAAGQGAAGQGGGAMPAANQTGKKKDQKEKRRPGYLVEDEETWASGKPSNPNVVD